MIERDKDKAVSAELERAVALLNGQGYNVVEIKARAGVVESKADEDTAVCISASFIKYVKG